MKKKIITKSYETSSFYKTMTNKGWETREIKVELDLKEWFKKNNWQDNGIWFPTYDEKFIKKVKERSYDKELNIEEKFTEIDGKRYGVYEKYYNNLTTFNEFVLNNAQIKSYEDSHRWEYENTENNNYRSPNDLVHNEYTDSWDEPTFEQQLSVIASNVDREVAFEKNRHESEVFISITKDEVFDKYMDLLICNKPPSQIFGSDHNHKLVKNFPMLVGEYENDLKKGDWYYHSFISDLIVCFSFLNPEDDMKHKDDVNGRILLSRYLKSNSTPNILNPNINHYGGGYELLKHYDDDEEIFLNDLIKLDWENRFSREKVFEFLDKFLEKEIDYNE